MPGVPSPEEVAALPKRRGVLLHRVQGPGVGGAAEGEPLGGLSVHAVRIEGEEKGRRARFEEGGTKAECALLYTYTACRALAGTPGVSVRVRVGLLA